MPPSLLNSDGRINSWPWFCMNDVNASSAVTSMGANLSYNESSEQKEELKNDANPNSIQSNQQNAPISCPSNIESDDVKNCNVSNKAKNSEKYEKGTDKMSFKQCSLNGNISSISSPLLDDIEVQSINIDTSSSPTGSPIHINQSQVI